MSDSDFPELPSFEAFDTEDRPPPPSIEDYPIGCEVELVDIGPAKVAQTAELWEPFMDELFGQYRRSVRVVRHQGDYTFVVCETEPDLIIGCTLYRACLSEPKVRFKKYMPSNATEGPIATIGVNTRDANDNGLFELYTSTHEDVVHEAEFAVPSAASPRGKDTVGASMWGNHRHSPGESPRRPRGGDGEAKSEVPSAGKGDAARYKYNYATRKAYDALSKENYKEAVRYYTKALKYSPDGGARCLSNRSVAYLGLRNVEAAFLDATRVIELTPQSFVGYVRAGNTLRGMKRYEEARTYYEKALALDPNNETLKYLLLSNAIMMLYASKYEHRKAASIALDRKTLNVVLLAKKDMRPGELAWVESSAAVVLLRYYGHVTDAGDSGVQGDQDKEIPPSVCFQCFRPLTSIEEFCKSLPEVEPSTLKKLYNEHKIVQCNGHCGVLYCSDSCRSKAWAAHHWVECVTQGKWSEAYRQVPGLLKDFATSYSAVPSSERHSGNNIHPEKGGCLSPILEDNVDVIVACARIACRMFAKILSNGRPLEDAVHIFEWMLPKESTYNSCVSPPTNNLVQKSVIDDLLIPVYNAFQQCFTAEEAHYLSFNAFLHSYERARFNCVKLRISAWPGIREKAGNYIDLMKIRTSETGAAPADGHPRSENAGGGSPTDSQLTQLGRIVNTPAESVAGYFECLGVFKVFAATFAPRCAQQEPQARYNVKVRPIIEPGAIIHIDVTESIQRDEQLVSDRLLNEAIA
ncbi:uncharacterized protein Tco025E_00935 [Trypanosoma conorhini]|uniref:Uncharacterized protein n=1 Tax=Trypanosoma conorhini TaxID=83891 RepID=A0A3R7N7T9_9TRYP|nr:uncharacterized protein Tco025E_00935 [Trypanosoma conorhini]RNF26853.1 hypothetical protein Tco025E_00935 [Trypanosoma conorhini]